MKIRNFWRTLIMTLLIISTMFVSTLANELHYEWVWSDYDFKYYWVECGAIQGTVDDPKGVRDTQYNGTVRGREIYDPASDAWYWLDAKYNGAKATDKEVWMPYVFQDEEPGSTDGKWVRYDCSGRMIKGWCVIKEHGKDNGVCYYDTKTGAMRKGLVLFSDGAYIYRFDSRTGRMVDDFGNTIPPDQALSYASCAMQFGEIYTIVDDDGHAYREINR